MPAEYQAVNDVLMEHLSEPLANDLLQEIQQRAAEILADIIGRQYGLEIKVHVERGDNDEWHHL